MTTNKQNTANRENSTHSTGPTSDLGKSTASQNALKHGLASGKLIMPVENEDDYTSLLNSLLEEHLPTTPTETLLIQDMAKFHWLTDRAIRLHCDAMGHTFVCLNDQRPLLTLLLRYQTANERAFHRSFEALIALRKRRSSENGSVSKSTPDHALNEAAKAVLNAESIQEQLKEHCKAPTDAAMNAAGFFKNPKTGTYDRPGAL